MSIKALGISVLTLAITYTPITPLLTQIASAQQSDASVRAAYPIAKLRIQEPVEVRIEPLPIPFKLPESARLVDPAQVFRQSMPRQLRPQPATEVGSVHRPLQVSWNDLRMDGLNHSVVNLPPSPITMVSIYNRDVRIVDQQGELVDELDRSKAERIWQGFLDAGEAAYGEAFWSTVLQDLGLVATGAAIAFTLTALQGTPVGWLVDVVVVGLVLYWLVTHFFDYLELIGDDDYEGLGALIFADVRTIAFTAVGATGVTLLAKLPQVRGFITALRGFVTRGCEKLNPNVATLTAGPAIYQQASAPLVATPAEAVGRYARVYRGTHKAEYDAIRRGEPHPILVTFKQTDALRFAEVHHSGELILMEFLVPEHMLKPYFPPNTHLVRGTEIMDVRLGHLQLFEANTYLVRASTLELAPVR